MSKQQRRSFCVEMPINAESVSQQEIFVIVNKPKKTLWTKDWVKRPRYAGRNLQLFIRWCFCNTHCHINTSYL
ncbi:MAG: hypothetical protein RBR41_11665, partial [Desulfovibrio sp.]|uniref:hypothetical protein n=1 Tax=Desulfovibrio sp. TaxID=885 RepID=UPI002A3680AB